MRMKAYLKMLVAMVAMFAAVACNNDMPPQDGPEPQPTVEVEVANITDSSLEFGVTTTNAAEVRYIFAESSEAAPSVDSILAEGVEVEENTNNNNVVALKFEELTPSTKYTLHVAVRNTHGTAYAFQEAETEEADVVEPTISIAVGEVGETAATFTITTTNATTVKYCVYDMLGGNPDELISAEEVLETGTAVEANTTVEVEVTDLTFGKEYEIVVAAEGESGVVAESETFKTATPAPVLSASLTEDVGYDYAVFSVEAENVAEVKYVCIKAGSRDVTAEQVMKNGTAIEAGDVKVEGLAEETTYEVYVAAKGVNEDVVMADVLTFTTTKNIIEYAMSASTTASAMKYSATNYYVTFTDAVNGYKLNLDFYIAEGNEYLISGEYPLAGFNAGEISAPYTSFMFTPADTVVTTFSSGSVTVVATPNEETREVYYEVSGVLYFADENYVTLNYSGLIEGIALPEVVEGAPEGAYVFEVSPSTSMPKRVHGSNLAVGEYYLKFYDKNWSELTLDLYVDPALCNNGNDGLPAGTYTMADGSFDAYSNISLYNPYFAGNFTEAELKVSVDGDNYTFVLLGTVVSGATEKVVYMSYTGEIKDMVK
ncbi:MAG: hypothetical protein IKY89_02485 [Alistipes sp.]|nr:hypothetical protein [Alistipes sp.]